MRVAISRIFGCLAIVVLVLQVVSCTSDYPDSSTGEVAGQVTYTGTRINSLSTPLLIVAAYLYKPDLPERLQRNEAGLAHASYMVTNPDFSQGAIPYQLLRLEPYEKGYFLTAVILDLDNPDAGAVASGMYPDMSIMFTPQASGTVQIVADEMQSGINFALADLPLDM
ncbi:MAG: hypothetical protein JXX14_20385 [Deltaproteobacteria bacterium]|nr:hypothetical protein [Deltaproteobacteria bacterium]